MENEKSFYPYYLSEILLVVFITLEVQIVLALAFPQTLGRMINFTAPFQPLPEWYFYWLYQLVRYFSGKWIFVGTVLIPLLAFGLLLFLPWIDRGKWGRLKAILVSMSILLAFLILTILTALNT